MVAPATKPWRLDNCNDIVPLLERILQVSKNLLIICEDCDGEALATLAVNKLRGALNVCAIKAPGFGDRRKDNLGDLATSIATLIWRMRACIACAEPPPSMRPALTGTERSFRSGWASCPEAWR